MATLDTQAGMRRRERHDPARSRAVAGAARTGWVFFQRVFLVLAIALFVGLALLPHLGLYRPVTVLTGSMRPTFAPGDTIFVRPMPVSDVRVGQIISYQVPTGARQVETHRVIRVLQGGAHPVVQTQGDANNAPDPWSAKLEGNTAWRFTAAVPKLGYLINALRSPTLRMLTIFIAPLVLALLFLLEIWGVRGAARAAEPLRGGAPPPKPRESALPFVIGHPSERS